MLALAALVTLLVAAQPAGLAAQQAGSANLTQPVIVTSGDAVVQRAPDQAFVTVAVETRAKSPRDAQRQNADGMTALQQRVTAAGIAREAVRTLGYTIQQEFDFADGRRTPRDFVAHNAVEIRLDAVDRVGEVLDLAIQAGATSVAGVRFDLKDRAGAEREALRLAVADARARAAAAAAGAGKSVDRVLRIDDTDARLSPVQPFPQRLAMARSGADAAASTPIETGVIEIHAQVTLTVSMK